MTTLAHTSVSAAGATPTRTAFLIHGILGSGRNWSTFAKDLVAASPDWRLVLVDLRHHGRSPGLPAPDTLQSCADDLAELARSVGTPEAMLGHSFGGKVALTYAERHGMALEALGVLDSLPAEPGDAIPTAETSDVVRVLSALAQTRVPAESRSLVKQQLLDQGLSKGIVLWLLTSLRRSPTGWRWVWDLAAIQRLIEDYWRTDLWPFVESPAARGLFAGELTFVRAGLSSRWTPDVLDRFSGLTPHTVRLVTLPHAGHWLHVDDPEGTLAAALAVLD